MFIQSLNKFIAIFLMTLIVCIPFSYAADPIIKSLETKDFLEGEETGIIINVAKYEPTVLVDSVLRETNAPLYVSLYGVPTTGKGVPKIKHITIRETDTNWLAGGIRYYPPTLYSWDNLGYFETKLKRVEKLGDIPETVDVNLVAKIIYESETTTELVGAVQAKTLKEKPVISTDELLTGRDYEIFDKGYIVANTISEKEARFTIYDSEGKKINSFSLDLGDESGEYRLIRDSRLNENIVRVRLDKINIGSGEKIATLEIGGAIKDLKTGSINDKCTLEKVYDDYVVIKRTVDRETFKKYLQTQEEREKKDLSSLISECGELIVLKGISSGSTVQVTVLTGRKRGELETTFSLHIPVEKGVIGFSTNELTRQMNKTKKLIEDFTKTIDNLENVVETWRKVCLFTSAFLVLFKFFSPVQTTVTTGKVTGAAISQLISKEGKSLFLNKADENSPAKQAMTQEGSNTLLDAYQNIVYDSEGDPYYYSAEAKEWILYSGLQDFGSAYPIRKDGESVIIVPIKYPEKLLSGAFKKVYNNTKEQWALDKGFYVIYYSTKLEIYQAIGEIDLGEKDDRHVKTIKEDDEAYIDFKNNYVQKISAAQREGKYEVDVNGNKWRIDTEREFKAPDLTCENIFCPTKESAGETPTGSCWQCSLLYNACDPVICPPSRCNLGGKFTVKGSVAEKGLIASLVLCAPNIKPSRGGVVMPICLSGILAGLKNIKSILEGYNACLLKQLKEDKTFGLCERVQSIYLCELIWKEVAGWLMLKGGIAGSMLALLTGGGVEYFTAPVSGRIGESKKVVDFFVQNYARDMYINYLGKSTKDVGSEICKSFVGGKLPSFGDFVDQFATPEAPPQFMAHFEEQPYSTTAGTSRYTVYYHIYAGTLKTKSKLDYYVYLTKKGDRDIRIARGTLTAEQWATDTITEIAPAGYEQICVNIDGVPNCNFGKLVSSSWALNGLADKFVSGEITKPINSKEKCVSESEGYLGMPVERTCETTNPYLGRGTSEENKWLSVGDCGFDENRVYVGKCWMKVQSNELMDQARTTTCEKEGLVYCKEGTVCKEGKVSGKDVECCQICEVVKETVQLEEQSPSEGVPAEGGRFYEQYPAEEPLPPEERAGALGPELINIVVDKDNIIIDQKVYSSFKSEFEDNGLKKEEIIIRPKKFNFDIPIKSTTKLESVTIQLVQYNAYKEKRLARMINDIEYKSPTGSYISGEIDASNFAEQRLVLLIITKDTGGSIMTSEVIINLSSTATPSITLTIP